MNGPIWGSGHMIASRPPKKYRCTNCGHRFNRYALERRGNTILCSCPQCGIELKRVPIENAKKVLEWIK